MAEVTIGNSPVHQDSILTGVYGQTGSSWAACGFHTGTDFARYGYSEQPNLYSVTNNGTVIFKRYENVLGYVVLIQDNDTGLYWRYCHLAQESSLSAGQQVNLGTVVGQMGQTGTGAHGIHLHLECSTSSSWSCANFVNPSTELGIPNESGTIVHYDGSIPPVPPPPPPYITRKNNWRNLYRKRYSIRF